MKKIHSNSILGQQGVTLVQHIIGEMGFLFYPTGSVEAGIDGTIELRNTDTGEVANFIIGLQSKAVRERFTAETDSSLSYICDERDLDYWMGGNVPVVLVVSRPSTSEAYWIHVQDYFRDPAVRKTRKVIFNKQENRFTKACSPQLISLAAPKGSGLYLPPPPFSEPLYSNLLEVTGISSTLWIGQAHTSVAKEIFQSARGRGIDLPGDWYLKENRIHTFHNLREFPWTEICDLGTVEEIDTTEFSDSCDDDIKRDFVRLLNSCLREKLWPDVLFYKEKKHYYFAATEDLRTRKESYGSLSSQTSRDVFRAYKNKKSPNKINYYRHVAFRGYFERYGQKWYLEIVPTYHYTLDGHTVSLYSEDMLSGIKRLERNKAVLGQTVFWSKYLSKEDLFDQYPFLHFGSLSHFELSAGLTDENWLKKEEKEQADALVTDDLIDDDLPRLEF